jgi:tRNA threonylcarbamoyl adenosine modification protein (Sua5/YciO/YrdC/YwlC family)
MIEYIVPNNPDDRVLKRASACLNKGQLICFPTDTNWIVCCSPYNKEGVDKLYKLKGVDEHKHFSVLCGNISQASEIALIDNAAFKQLKKCTPGHYTFIFPALKKITKYLKASKTDKEIGIRFIPSYFIQTLIESHGDVLLSTNLNHQILNLDENFPIYSAIIEDQLSNMIEMIIDPGEFDFVGPSTIISYVEENGPELIREGAGNIDQFNFE